MHDSTMVMRLLCSRSATAALEGESLDSSNIIILSSSSSLLTAEAQCPHHLACPVEELGRDGAEDVQLDPRLLYTALDSYNHQVGSARGRPAYFPRLLGGALQLSHGAAAPLLQPGHRVLPRAGLAAGLDGGGAAGPPLHQSLINILIN